MIALLDMRALFVEFDEERNYKLIGHGDISKPITYRTDDGKDAVRILYYKSRVPPHQASLNDDWNRIQKAALNQKKNKVLEKWFDKAQRDVFINIDSAYDMCGIIRQE